MSRLQISLLNMRCLLPLLGTLFAVASAQYGQDVGMTQFVNSVIEGSRAENGTCKNMYEVLGLEKQKDWWNKHCENMWNKDIKECTVVVNGRASRSTDLNLPNIQWCAKTCFSCNRTKIELAAKKRCQKKKCNFKINRKTETAMTSCEKKRQRRSADPVVCTEVTADTGNGETVIPLRALNMSCDSTSDGGRWIVFMRRLSYMSDVDYNFDRDWQAYKTGFGSPEGNFWWGLEKLHRLVADGKFELRIDITTKEERKIVVTNDYFMVNNEDEKYAFYASGPFKVNGTSGKKINNPCGEPSFNVEKLNFEGLKSQFFTTKDADNDQSENINCAVQSKMGFWYNRCSSTDTNDGTKMLITAPFVEMKVRQRQGQTKNTRKRHILKKRSQEESQPALCTETTPHMENCPRVPVEKLITKAECDNYEGGWMVIQRRSNNKTDFDRTWDEYKYGFGDPHNGGSFWWGLENLHRLTTSGNYNLMLDVFFQDGLEYDVPGYAVHFKVLSEKENYKLEVGSNNLKGGASLSDTMRPNTQFTTKDRDNTEHGLNCAKKYGGGFWWVTYQDKKTGTKICVMRINFNGVYGDTGEKGLLWYSMTNKADHPDGRFSYMEMKIRPSLNCPEQ